MVQYVEDRSSETQFELGQMFHKTKTNVQDYEQAVKWYTQSAKQGHRRAQHRLGAMYAKGLGVNVNYIKAYAWCKVAASQQSRRALLMLKKIEKKCHASKSRKRENYPGGIMSCMLLHHLSIEDYFKRVAREPQIRSRSFKLLPITKS